MSIIISLTVVRQNLHPMAVALPLSSGLPQQGDATKPTEEWFIYRKMQKSKTPQGFQTSHIITL